MNRCFLSCLRCLTYPLERAGRAGPALCPGRVALGRVPLGQLPSLHRLRRPFRGVVRRLRRYYGAVRLPVLVHHRRASSDFPMRPVVCAKASTGSPGSRARCFRACTGSQTAQGSRPSRDGDGRDVAFRSFPRRRHPGGEWISRLNTRPARTPVNASPSPLRTPAHDSGPMWLARPSPCGSFIRNISPVSTGARKTL